MSDKTPDVNDRLKAGTLPVHPTQGTERVALRVVKPEERKPTGEPADVAAERALLGALLWSGANAPDVLRAESVVGILESGEPFYVRDNGDVFDACLAVHKVNAEHDTVAVAAELSRTGKMGKWAASEGLESLKDAASTVSERQARVYAQAIRDAWARRTAIRDARLIAEDARNPQVSATVLLERAQALAVNYSRRASSSAATVSIKESLESMLRKLMSGKNTAVSTGLVDLDTMTNGGLRPGETTILAARPNVGKSNLSAGIGEHMASVDPTLATLIVTLEMKHEMYTARLLSARSGVPLVNFRKMVLTPTQWDAITRGANELSTRGLYFADAKSQTLAQVYAAALERQRLLNAEGKRLGLLIIDHVGLVKPSAELLKRASREQQVAETSRALGQMASELVCHVMGIAHINRSSENAPDNMPGIHQLRESGSLEGDADNVLILHRERSPKTKLFRTDRPAALALAKGRLDETAVCLLDFDGKHGKFTNYSGSQTFEQAFGD